MKKAISNIFKKVKKNILILIFFIVIGLISGFVFKKYEPVNYTSTSTIYVNNSDNLNSTLNTYAYQFKTKHVIDNVIKHLKIDNTYEQIFPMISTNVIDNSNLIEVSVTSNNLELSEKVSKNLISVFNNIALQTYGENVTLINFVTNTNSLDNGVIICTTVISFLLGLILIIIFGSDDSSIKNHEELAKNLHIKSLGVVPKFHGDEDIKKKSNIKGYASNIILLRNPNSIISESYRMIRTNLDFLDTKVINFTSTTANEGKSGTIANLALSFASLGKKVLLIDCDLRKPSIHKFFEVNRTLGLSDILVYNRIEKSKEFIQAFKIPNSEFKLDILAAGSKVSNASELLNRNCFKELIDKVKEEYDVVLIDCPPIGIISDAGIVGRICDGTVYIVEYNNLNYNKIQDGLDSLANLKTRVLGGILTKVDMKKQKKLYGNKNDYYSEYM